MRRSVPFVASLAVMLAATVGPAPSAGAVEPFGAKPAPVRDVVPGVDGSQPEVFARLGSKVLFSATDADHGYELWVTDGTKRGTRLVKDILPGTSGSMPANLTAYQGRVFFSALDATHGIELWVSDGTATGTKLFKDLNGDPSSTSPQNLKVLNGTLWMSADTGVGAENLGRELWASDGTVAGTRLVKDLNPGSAGSSPYRFTDLGATIAFTATTATAGEELWVSDGTADGTSMVKDINAGSGWANITDLTAAGTPDGPVVLFGASNGTSGRELWHSDGTPGGTTLLHEFQFGGPEGNPRNFRQFQGKTYFVATDGTTGYELWRTDGVATTERVTDLNPDAGGGVGYVLPAVGGKLFLLGGNGTLKAGLFRYDGTSAQLVKDVNPGGSLTASSWTVVDGRLFFEVFGSTYGDEVWTSDGTAAGTRVLDINPGVESSWPAYLTPVFNSLVFRAADATVGTEPFVYTVRASTTAVKPAASYTRRQARLLRIKVPVVVRGAAGLTGTVVLRKGTTYLGSARVVDGKATVRITARKLAVGKHKVRATYSGSWKARRSVSTTVTVKVR